METGSKAEIPVPEAQWMGAIRELEQLNFLQAQGSKREVFRLTHEGYSLAELLRGRG